jgi:MFS family permease
MFSVLLLFAGTLSDRAGAHRAYAAGMVLFLLALAAYGLNEGDHRQNLCIWGVPLGSGGVEETGVSPLVRDAAPGVTWPAGQKWRGYFAESAAGALSRPPSE